MLTTAVLSILAIIIVVIIVHLVVFVLVKRPRAQPSHWKAYETGPDRIYTEKSVGGRGMANSLAPLLRSADGPGPTDHHRQATITIRRNLLPRAWLEADIQEFTGLNVLRLQEQLMAVLDGGGRTYNHPPLGRRPGVDWSIDTVNDFAFETLDPVPFATPPNNAGLVIHINRETADRRRRTLQARQAVAAEVSDGARGARTEVFLDLSQQNTSDVQNSHDTAVNAAKRAIIDRLRVDQGSIQLPSPTQITDELRRNCGVYSRDPRTGEARPALTEKAIAVVQRARIGEFSASARVSDEEVLCRVWARAADPRNAKNSGLLRRAFFDALVDCWEHEAGGEAIQCVDGRIGRVLSSLTLLDWDERNWEMRRLEQYRNDIYVLAGEVIRAAAVEAAEQTADPVLQEIGRAYLATSYDQLLVESGGAKEREWIADTKARMARAIDAHIVEVNSRVPGAIPQRAIAEIKSEALAALDT